MCSISANLQKLGLRVLLIRWKDWHQRRCAWGYSLDYNWVIGVAGFAGFASELERVLGHGHVGAFLVALVYTRLVATLLNEHDEAESGIRVVALVVGDHGEHRCARIQSSNEDRRKCLARGSFGETVVAYDEVSI